MYGLVTSIFSSMEQQAKRGSFVDKEEQGNALEFVLPKLPKGKGGLFPSAVAPQVVFRLYREWLKNRELYKEASPPPGKWHGS
jgi:hypothetical protein